MRRIDSFTFTWLGIAAFLLPGCIPVETTSGYTHTWPTHGNQYYNYRDAKYLGSDSADQLSFRLIDSPTFDEIVHSGDSGANGSAIVRRLLDASRPITIDNVQIQADLQWVRDSSLLSGREYQVYLYIDRNTAQISSLHGDPGTSRNSHPFVGTDRNHGTVSPISADSPRNSTGNSNRNVSINRNGPRNSNGPSNSSRILIGQVHGHPASTNGITLHCLSRDDSLTAVALQAPIYAVDAMEGEKGTPGSIHRANPDPGKEFAAQDLWVGKTSGIKCLEPRDIAGSEASGAKGAKSASATFNIGVNALRIWGLSRHPDFDLIRKIDSTISASDRDALASIQR